MACKNPDAKMRIGYLKKHENIVNTNGLKYPVQVKDIGKFERNNQNISISVYGFDETERIVYPVRVVSELAEHHINFLFYNPSSCRQFLYLVFLRIVNLKPDGVAGIVFSNL